MTPTDELREQLRELMDEVIPDGGAASDTRFADDQLDRILIAARNLYAAAAEGWTRKAGMLSRELGNIDEYAVGQERYRTRSLQTAISGALAMAKQYSGMARAAGSVVLKFKPPGVL